MNLAMASLIEDRIRCKIWSNATRMVRHDCDLAIQKEKEERWTRFQKDKADRYLEKATSHMFLP
jgi:hypothetical protein